MHSAGCDRGIVVSGSGAGAAVAVAVSKLPGIRAAVGHDTYTAAQGVQRDDCNVLALAARAVGPMLAAARVRACVNAAFSGEERHVRRLRKIDVMEQEGFGD
jgi:ribose 5-phosphate isomerase B